jgi:phosphoheptose isomerase
MIPFIVICHNNAIYGNVRCNGKRHNYCVYGILVPDTYASSIIENHIFRSNV